MKPDEFSIAAWKCHTCGEALDHGSRVVVAEDSVIGINEFVPKNDRNDVLVFCSDEHFLDYTILDDMHSYRGTSQPPIVASTRAPNQPACDRCGAPLSYGMRAFRVHDSTIDELDSTRPIDPSDSSLFCSKHCADRSMLWFRSKSIADIWDEVQRRVEES